MSGSPWHRLLARQLRHLLGDTPPPDAWLPLLELVSEAYRQSDADREMLERSLELSSQELLQANRDLRAIFGLLPDMFFRVNGDNVILDCNLGRMPGGGHPPELRGRRLTEAPNTCGGSVLIGLLEESRAHGARVVRETELPMPGAAAFAEVSIIPLHAEEHIIFVRDITARRRAEESSHRLAAAVEQAADAVLITDTRGTIQYVNPAFEHILGYRRDEVQGKTPALLKSGRHDGDFYEKLWGAIESGRIWKGRFTDRRKDGSLVELNAAISPIRDASGKIVHYVAVSHDVTREMELEDQLRQAQKMEAIGRLAGGIAHDFNNLLTAMMGNADLVLRRLNATSPVREDIEQIREAAQQAAALIAQLLTFSRKQVVHPRPVHINEVVGNMVRLLKRIIGNRVELTADLDPTPGIVRADPVQIEQVIMNLALNARDAMPEGGKLVLRTRGLRLDRPAEAGLAELAAGLYTLLQVTDSGTGMDAQTKARLFEPFFTTKEIGRGTGLGLATVYGIVRQCGGAILVESAPGAGSTFSVYLPQARAALATSPGIAPPPPEHPRTILVVDDETPVRKLVAKMLVEAGYQIMEAGDGREAMDVLQRHGPDIDLLLTDVIMPRMDGHELKARVRADHPRLPVVLMSGHPETAESKPESLNGQQFYVRKPFRTENLLDVLQHALAQKS
ncbi:MAG TPA: PAS domain S-box protein [Kiritimatiellia bacterium]|nr:PAS domain S-box protein [Kiritimatiellia bacterium]